MTLEFSCTWLNWMAVRSLAVITSRLELIKVIQGNEKLEKINTLHFCCSD